MIIAIDGPAAAGKGTLARRLAKHFGLAYLDTGLIYRAVGMGVVRQGGDPDEAEIAESVAAALTPRDLEAQDLRGDAAADAASRVSAIPGVRARLLAFERNF
ncbi:MAG: (d)CMP kinase, partial [Rhodospirillales bacterium]|nr:(d)CMP kinase [Rhodospirillales bacterium]